MSYTHTLELKERGQQTLRLKAKQPLSINAKVQGLGEMINIRSSLTSTTLLNSQRFGPAGLFALNEPGVWLDPSDLTTMFQDRAGSTPVTAPGQSVGLRLDKSKGLIQGPELVTNGDFSGGSTDWTFAGAAPLGTVSGGAATFVGGAAGNRFLSQANRVVVGRTYAVTATVTVSAGDVGPDMTGTNVRVSTSGTYTWRLVASITAVSFIANSAFAGTIDNISVRELPGFHAVANSDAARGVYGIEPVGGRRNLLTFTEQFDNAAWPKSNVTVTANVATAPDGTTTAERFTADAATANHRVISTAATLASGLNCVHSVYLKAGTHSFMQIHDGASASYFANFNVSTGVVGTATGCTAVMTDVGNGWYRCSIAMTLNGANPVLCISMVTSNTAARNESWTAVGTETVLVWGAQLEVGSVATPYQRVVDQYNVTESGVPSVHYVQYDGSDDGYVTPTISPNLATSDGAARRNLLLYPSMFDDSEWTKGGTTISANTAVAPDGTTTADKMVEDGTTGVHRVLTNTGITVVSGSSYIWSVYAKAAERTVVRVSNNSLAGATFDLSNSGATSSVSGGITATASSVGNGWFRLSISTTAATTTERIVVQTVVGGNTSYAGDGTSGILLWGAQLELGTTVTTFQNIGTDKAQVFAGVRKLSDAAIGALLETSANSNSNNGALWLLAPGSPGSSMYSFRSKGTTAADTNVTGYAAPVTSVVCGLGDISADRSTIRVNGAQVGQNTGDQGTGNYLAYPLYIGRRGGVDLSFNGRDYGILVRFGPNLDTATIAATEAWIGNKTGFFAPTISGVPTIGVT